MKPEQLKLYNKYKDKNYPEIEYIYIGIDSDNEYYWFIYKDECDLFFHTLELYGFNPHKIVNDLNLEIININNFNYIKGYNWEICPKHFVETNLKPILKDKLNNIINR